MQSIFIETNESTSGELQSPPQTLTQDSPRDHIVSKQVVTTKLDAPYTTFSIKGISHAANPEEMLRKDDIQKSDLLPHTLTQQASNPGLRIPEHEVRKPFPTYVDIPNTVPGRAIEEPSRDENDPTIVDSGRPESSISGQVQDSEKENAHRKQKPSRLHHSKIDPAPLKVKYISYEAKENGLQPRQQAASRKDYHRLSGSTRRLVVQENETPAVRIRRHFASTDPERSHWNDISETGFKRPSSPANSQEAERDLRGREDRVSGFMAKDIDLPQADNPGNDSHTYKSSIKIIKYEMTSRDAARYLYDNRLLR